MTQQTKGAPALIFNETKFSITHRNGQQWLRLPQIEGALGYSKKGRAIGNLYKKHAAEFTDSMTALVKLKTAGGEQEVRIFSLRGAHLLGMFARTEKAAEFRRWILDILDNEIEAQAERRAKPGALKSAPQPVPQARAALPAPSIDVRRLLLEGQSDPKLPLPAEIHSAINRRAWTMAHEVYELLREHLARRVAYTCEMGSPRYLNTERALEVIAECDINRALAHTYYSGLHHCASMARSAKILSAEYLAEMEKALEGKAH